MPLLVKDYTWHETDAEVVLKLPLKGVKSSKVDVTSTDRFIKVRTCIAASLHPHLATHVQRARGAVMQRARGAVMQRARSVDTVDMVCACGGGWVGGKCLKSSEDVGFVRSVQSGL